MRTALAAAARTNMVSAAFGGTIGGGTPSIGGASNGRAVLCRETWAARPCHGLRVTIIILATTWLT